MKKIAKPTRNSHRARVATPNRIKKIAVDFPVALYEQTERALVELETSRSAFIRDAVVHYLDSLRRKKLEDELIQGYIANASSAQTVAEELMAVEGDLV